MPNTNGSGRSFPAAKLGAAAPGVYTVFYRGPNDPPVRIGEITVPAIRADNE